MPTIVYASYPHVVEDILFHADYETKLAFRLTCRALRDCTDNLLCGPTLSYPEGEVGCRRLPFFHPHSGNSRSGRAKQHRAINTARLILLDSAVATPDDSEALSNIHPDSRVVLNHEQDAVATYRLPELAELTILGSHQCRCNDVDGGFDDPFTPMDVPQPPTLPGDLRDPDPRHTFAHAARQVHIDLSLRPTSDSSHHFRCALAKCALNRDVRRLTITVSEIFHLGMVLAPLQQKLNPGWRREDFEIEVRFRGQMPEFDVRALLAGLIELDPERVTVEAI
ncbi:hypothetical protein A1Q1_04751 [Trichosporon asahii var. asahii CBS 2479]|uniref:F-box domain-containing protein n=1 Tax=Trichosporon asahii var. asahii (strain ATCC 90039 / CBS 2479 / JCM 2466 / KCTC 7840 / NBRC 103889/ NCYC 2677 / UAMH 7654) TaxID=1186058 RepID=J6EQ45_TRIAS|nr:hypothetical protein A1Q1_04751 [Trichosporon asahii var. asahii CBS 2479]EJT46574.1 hypothetical protein A1Q1_04751 [Trichosporon asahii var. asahii CBS 2479]